MQRLFFLLFLIGVSSITKAQDKIVLKSNGIERLTGGAVLLSGKNVDNKFEIKSRNTDGVYLYHLQSQRSMHATATDAVGLFFNNLPHTSGQVVLWRYQPWISWTKPIHINQSIDMPVEDVQFYYWKYDDGTYGAAVPLSGNGYRTTLGKQGNKWGTKSQTLVAGELPKDIPAVAIAFGNNPFDLFNKIYKVALEDMGKGNNLRSKKKFPEPLKYFGWCTYNALPQVSEKAIISAVKDFTKQKFPLKMVLLDGGWNQTNGGRLKSQKPDSTNFPNGFKIMNDYLKNQLGIKFTGVWHNFNGDLYGIDPNSKLGIQYKNDLFAYRQKKDGDSKDTSSNVYYYFKPNSKGLGQFYDTWYAYFKQQGFDFTKVDNQSVTEKMAPNHYKIFTFSEKIHKAVYDASYKYLHGYLINCMDMTADAYLNFGSTPVARTVEDYFPYFKGETYDLQRGNAAAHVLQAIYNSIYFSQMAFPDFDMFASDNPNAQIHAVARALNCGPIYVTDKPGHQNFDILNALVYRDGKIVNSENPLLPTEDCLFQVQDKKIFKAFTMVGNAGLLDVFNAADANMVFGNFSPSDINNINGENFLVYEHFSNNFFTAKKKQEFDLELPRLGYKLYYVVPVKNGFAPVGLTQKYNAPATIISQKYTNGKAEIKLYEGGEFKAWSQRKPASVLVNGKLFTNYSFDKNMISMKVPFEDNVNPVITFNW
jgi:raffinose synthase